MIREPENGKCNFACLQLLQILFNVLLVTGRMCRPDEVFTCSFIEIIILCNKK